MKVEHRFAAGAAYPFLVIPVLGKFTILESVPKRIKRPPTPRKDELLPISGHALPTVFVAGGFG